MKHFLLCPNPSRDLNHATAERVREILTGVGAQAEILPYLDISPNALMGVDAIITFGGDGTILHAARSAAGTGVPLLGVNLGNKGFIAELERGDIAELTRLVREDFTVQERMMADVTVERGGRQFFADFVLNDICLNGVIKMIDITVYGDGRKITAFSGDGIVVATPTGSTAYSLSAGGPIVEPDAENLIVTPVCPHVLWAKPYVLAAERVVTIELGKLKGKSACLSTDGSDPIYLKPFDRITVRRSILRTRLIRFARQSFYERVSEKLGETK